MAVPLLAELNRRRVFRALIGYGIAAFAVLQIVEPIIHGFHWPESVLSYVVVALALGFPVVVTLAWIFDVNAGAIERTIAAPGTSAVRRFGPVLVLVAIGSIAATPGMVWYFLIRQTHQPAAQRGASDGVAPVIPSIAVLPFVNLSSDREQDYFADGIAEEILNALGQVEGLHVSGRTSSFSFKGKNEDLRSIGEKLNVGALLEGSVRKAGTRIRITAQIVNVRDGYHIWSQTFDRELADVFAIQDEIARAVVGALKVKLLSTRAPVTGEAHTTKPEAHNQYLLGRQFVRQGSNDAYRRAMEAFRRAIAIDPGYAMAYVGLSEALWGTYNAGDSDSRAATLQLQEGALAAAERAVAFGPTLADAFQQRGAMRIGIQWDWTGGRADLEHALSLNPGHAGTLDRLGFLLALLGDRPAGIAHLKKAVALDPLSADRVRYLGFLYQANGQLALAREAFTRAVQVAPEHDWALFFLSMSFLVGGEPEQALVTTERSRTEGFRLMGRALAKHTLGRPDESRLALSKMIASWGHVAAYQIAEVFAWRGERDEAMAWLERCYRERDSGLTLITLDPLVRDLHGDPRYKALLRKMNLPTE